MDVSIPLGHGNWTRNRADQAEYALVNRFFEQAPNDKEQTALIERPALIDFLDSGPGPGRRLFRQPGFSNGDLFHVSGNELWKHHMNPNRTITSTQIPGLVDGTGSPDIAATMTRLWITDGFDLQYTNGTAALTPIPTPDDIPFISLDVFNGYILCVQNNSDRFYWIEPGAVTINPLNFATAERNPDHVLQVRTVGDEFWLLGEKTVEVWRATGDGDAPFQRIEGRLFDKGIWGGTAVRIRDSVVVAGEDGIMYDISGQPRPISNPSVSEIVRNAIKSAIELGQ